MSLFEISNEIFKIKSRRLVNLHKKMKKKVLKKWVVSRMFLENNEEKFHGNRSILHHYNKSRPIPLHIPFSF